MQQQGQTAYKPHKNHDPHMEQESTWMESQQKQQQSLGACGSLDNTSKIQRT